MLKRFRVVGLCLVAVFAVSAVASASASAALPEFVPSTKQTFTSTSGVSTLAAGAFTITCEKDTNAGEITGAKTVGKVVVKFTKCTIKVLFTFECKSKGAANGEIVTNALKGTLGYIEGYGSGVGLKLEPETASEYTNGEIECAGSNKVKVTGAVIGEVTPINTSSTKGELIFKRTGTKQESGEEIEIEHVRYEHVKLMSSLNGGTAGPAAEETTDKITFKEAVEVKA